MSVFAMIDRYMAGLHRMRELARTERMIRALPAEVQKDIGWPDAHEENRRHIGHPQGRPL